MPNLLPFILIFIMWSGAAMCAAVPFVIMGDWGSIYQLLSVGVAPLLFGFSFAIIGGLLSRIGNKGIVRGKYPRELMHKTYFWRRIYSACWTQLYYFKPVYAVVLAIPMFKKLVFRLYGFTGPCDFIAYPDTWIRDLPILKIEAGAYLSNRATIGTNICLSDGTILVDGIRIGKKAMVGHFCMLAPGVKIGDNSEIGVGSGVGIRVNIKEDVSIKPNCTINHGVVIGQNADIGTRSYLGLRCNIADGIKIPAGANIPAGTIIQTQDDVDKFHSSESEKLKSHKDLISEIVAKHTRHAI